MAIVKRGSEERVVKSRRCAYCGAQPVARFTNEMQPDEVDVSCPHHPAANLVRKATWEMREVAEAEARTEIRIELIRVGAYELATGQRVKSAEETVKDLGF